jgi:hypothetical protein
MILLLFYVWYEAKFQNEFGIWSVPYWVPVVGGKIVLFVICTVFGFDLGSDLILVVFCYRAELASGISLGTILCIYRFALINLFMCLCILLECV